MCLNQNRLKPDQQYTIRVLQKYAKASNCEQASIRLASIDSISLTDKGIKDLSPIGTLKNLSELNLMNNKIRDLEPLKGLDQLQTLNLAENHIENFIVDPVFRTI